MGRRIAIGAVVLAALAVAVVLSMQPGVLPSKPPQDPSPESANLVRMPFACGSQK